VLFAEQDGSRSAVQIKAFEDTWRWDQAAGEAWQEVGETGGRMSQAMQAFRSLLGGSAMLAYLALIAPRLVVPPWYPRRCIDSPSFGKAD